jgi:hypothetical protein
LYSAYCDMQGGGWTLALKVANGAQFGYDDSFWTAETVVMPSSTNMDEVTAKFLAFQYVSVSEVLIKFKKNDQKLSLPVTASNLRNVFLGSFRETNAGFQAWQQLIPGSGMQANCKTEGINLAIGSPGTIKARIGIIANNENDCNSPDSVLGMGIVYSAGACPDAGAPIYVGNRACDMSPRDSNGNNLNGAIAISAFAYVFVR